MKPWTRVLVVLVLGLGATAVFYSASKSNVAKLAAAARAWAEFQTARATFLRDIQPPPRVDIDSLNRQRNAWSNYMKAIDAINTRACPMEFQEAMLEYRQALERQDVGNLQVALELLPAVSGDFDGIQAQQSRAALVKEARFKLERLALRYGLTAPTP